MNTKHMTRNAYYVDEAGDTTLFKRHGNVIIGQEGCSNYFAVGYLDIPNITSLITDLDNLHKDLVHDPYFSGIPSMQPESHKTYDFFHAKDDVPEVRREVFRILKQHDELRFHAVIQNKQSLLEYVRNQEAEFPDYRYNPNNVYDYFVKILFQNALHKEEKYYITFAKRGRSDRTEALQRALVSAQRLYDKKHQTNTKFRFDAIPEIPQNNYGLQAVDYYLWALQRLYERKEDRYFEYLKDSFCSVQDISDITYKPVLYTRKKPLSLAALRVNEANDIGTISNEDIHTA